MAGAVRVGNTVAAAIANTRVLEPVEAHIAVIAGIVLGALGTLAFMFPRAIAYPIAVLAAWMGIALLDRGFMLLRRRSRSGTPPADGTRGERHD
jgi:cardiolipin synthase A/B